MDLGLGCVIFMRDVTDSKVKKNFLCFFYLPKHSENYFLNHAEKRNNLFIGLSIILFLICVIIFFIIFFENPMRNLPCVIKNFAENEIFFVKFFLNILRL